MPTGNAIQSAFAAAPGGAAGGVLSGTFPNPGFANGAFPSWTPADSGLLAWSHDPVADQGGQALVTAGTLNVAAVKLAAAASVTNIILRLTTAGATLTAGQCFAALYQGAAGVLLGVTADQSAAWVGATGVLTMPISGGPVAAAAGLLRVAMWFNGTTGPSFRRAGNVDDINAGLAAAAARYGTANTGVTTTAPNPLGTLAALSTAYWAGLS